MHFILLAIWCLLGGCNLLVIDFHVFYVLLQARVYDLVYLQCIFAVYLLEILIRNPICIQTWHIPCPSFILKESTTTAHAPHTRTYTRHILFFFFFFCRDYKTSLSVSTCFLRWTHICAFWLNKTYCVDPRDRTRVGATNIRAPTTTTGLSFPYPLICATR